MKQWKNKHLQSIDIPRLSIFSPEDKLSRIVSQKKKACLGIAYDHQIKENQSTLDGLPRKASQVLQLINYTLAFLKAGRIAEVTRVYV